MYTIDALSDVPCGPLPLCRSVEVTAASILEGYTMDNGSPDLVPWEDCEFIATMLIPLRLPWYAHPSLAMWGVENVVVLSPAVIPA